MSKLRNSKGFTLIELMIVVVIIGILAALAIPRFNVASHKSKEKEADVLLNNIYKMQQAYRSQHGVFATSEAELQTVGFEQPPVLQFYDPPGTYTIPLCLASKGSWKSRGVDANGDIDDC